MKVALEAVGEIDFIATAPVVDVAPIERTIQGRNPLLEGVPAIIASKVHSRGSHLKVRDIFDIAAACEAGHYAGFLECLAKMPAESAVALKRLGQLPSVRLVELMSKEDVRPGFEHLLAEAPSITRTALTFQPGP